MNFAQNKNNSAQNADNDAEKAIIGHLTRFTSDRPLGKRFDLDASGRLTKSTLGEFARGTFDVRSFGSAAELAALLAETRTDQAVSGSLPLNGAQNGRIVRKADVRDHPGALARSKDHFCLIEAPGVMTLDYDPQPGDEPLSREALVALLLTVAPGLRTAGLVWWASGSSFVRTTDGRELQGLRGQRIYVLAANAAEIPAACDNLADRLWLGGYGRIIVSASGAKLERHVFDDSMKQPARLDFAGGAVLGPGLESGRGAPRVLNEGGFVSLAEALPPLSPKDAAQVAALKAAAREKAEPTARAAREAHIARTAPELANRLIREGVPPAEAHERGQAVARAAHDGCLMGDFEIVFDDGTTATVGAILDDRERYHGRITLDPLEPEYLNRKPVGRLYLFGAVPNLYSFAHGGRVYRLQRQPARVALAQGRSHAAALEIIGKLADDGDVFVMGGVPVRVQCGRAVPLASRSAMTHVLEARMAFTRPDRQGDAVPCDLPPALAERVIEAITAEGNAYGIPEIVGVVGQPFATPNGLVARPGRDPTSRVFADFDPTELEAVPVRPDRAALVEAMRVLWGPWSGFPCATDNDRAALLAAILSALCRPGLDIAPGVLIEAPSQGSGKTLIAESLGALMLGRVPGLLPFSGADDAELRKQIIADLLTGSPVFILDNVVGFYDSPTLAGLMTGASVRGRILGSSQNFAGEPRMLPILTANNANLGADFASRMLRIRIDPQTDRPQARRFAFHPTRRVLSERWDLMRAFVCLMRGFFAAGAPAPACATRFGQWAALVCGCVEWLRDSGIDVEAGVGVVGDPAASLSGAASQIADMRTEGFRRLASAMLPVWGGRAFGARELLPMLTGQTTDAVSLEVRDALEALMPERWKPSAINIGRCLSDWRDNIAGGVVLRMSHQPASNVRAFRWCEAGA